MAKMSCTKCAVLFVFSAVLCLAQCLQTKAKSEVKSNSEGVNFNLLNLTGEIPQGNESKPSKREEAFKVNSKKQLISKADNPLRNISQSKNIITSSEIYKIILNNFEVYRSNFISIFNKWFKSTLESIASSTAKTLNSKISNVVKCNDSYLNQSTKSILENNTTPYVTSFEANTILTKNITTNFSANNIEPENNGSRSSYYVTSRISMNQEKLSENQDDPLINLSSDNYNDIEMEEEITGNPYCANTSLNISVIEHLMKKRTEEDRSRSQDFADRFYKHLLEVEQLVVTEEDYKYINLSSIVHTGFQNRLRYANEEVVNHLLQILPSPTANEIMKPEKDDCLLHKTMKRLKMIHRIITHLILSMPWSTEDILSSTRGEWLIDNVFRPMAKAITDMPCLKCYRRVYGRCQELFACKHGTGINNWVPAGFTFP